MLIIHIIIIIIIIIINIIIIVIIIIIIIIIINSPKLANQSLKDDAGLGAEMAAHVIVP